MKGWEMYSKIQAMKAKGFSIRQVSRIIRVSRNTIKKYWEMAPEDYATKYQIVNRLTALTAYEPIIVRWLETYPCMTAAQVRDWMSERYKLDASERTVRRLVARLREVYGITQRTTPRREYEAVEELPKGKQLQLDFGEKTVRDAYSSRYVKLYFAVFTLTYSRYKWGVFQEKPFTSSELVRALYGCFDYCGGMPKQLVYDQDSIIVVSENHGDIIHTQAFTGFLQETKLETRVCRKNDPQSKGLIESAVKFVKRNFMENRQYMGIAIWNQSFGEWLERTGNGKEHGTTKRKPTEMFAEEQEHLLPLYGKPPETMDGTINGFPSKDDMERAVRPDNTILYHSNRYSVPYGTYGKIKTVTISAKEGKLHIADSAGTSIAAHEIDAGKGRLIKAASHRQDRESKTEDRLNKAVSLLGEEFREYLTALCQRKPRYARDQLKLVQNACEAYGRMRVLKAVRYCLQWELYSAGDLLDASEALERRQLEIDGEDSPAAGIKTLSELSGQEKEFPHETPVKSTALRIPVTVQNRPLSIYAEAAEMTRGSLQTLSMGAKT